jgi:hypothetical protein
MAKIPSPIGPTIDVASKTISSSVIRGGAGGGGGGGNVEPQTSAIVRRNSTDIVQVRKDINAITKAQTESVTVFRNTVASLSDQFRTIGVFVRDLGSNVSGLNRGITTDTNLEVTKDRQELERERRLAERGEREGKEKQLEQKLQQALLAPARFITNRAKGVLDNLMNAFGLFFLGWLSNKIIDTIKNRSGKTSNIFKDIFDSIIGGVTQYFKSLLFVNKVFANIARLAFGITKLISKTLVGGLNLLFGALRGVAKGTVNFFKGAGKSALEALGILPKVAAEAGTEAATKAGTRAATEAGAELALRGGSRLAGSALPFLGAAPDFIFALSDLYQGDYKSSMYSALAGLATLSTPFTFGWGHVASLGLTGLSIQSSMEFNNQKESKTQPSTPQTTRVPQPTSSTSPAAKTAPAASEPLTPYSGSFGVDTTGMEFGVGNDYGESSTPLKSQAQTNPPDKTQPNLAQTQSIPSPIPQVGPAPAPKPNVVMLSSAQNNQSSTVLKSSPQAASNVPFIPSSNPDNFYVLYSQVNYNVVV